jgi:TDG/mug DNA glycosylase family protein
MNRFSKLIPRGPTSRPRSGGRQTAPVAFRRVDLIAFHGATLPDLLGPQVRVLFVGINPGLLTAAVQAHFARRGNRFYPALHLAGITDRIIDASGGYRPEDRAHLIERGVGNTNIVARATARADELTPDELIAGALDLTGRVARIRPKVVAILGIGAYRGAFDRPKAQQGRQPDDLAGVPLWVAPNPSGLNAHARLEDLAAAYRQIAVSAGMEPLPTGGG